MVTFEDLLQEYLSGQPSQVTIPRPVSPISPIPESPIPGVGDAIGSALKSEFEKQAKGSLSDLLTTQATTPTAAPYGTINTITGEAIGTSGVAPGYAGATVSAPYGPLIDPITGEFLGTAGASVNATAAAPPVAAAPISPFASFGYGTVGALGLNDLMTHKRGEVRGAAQGAASGAAIGTSILPGPGTAIGAVLGGIYGGFTGHKPKTQQEEGRWQKLVEEGKVDASNFRERETINFNENFDENFMGIDPNTGEYVNNKFATTRDERYLTKQDAPKYRWGAVWREQINDFDTFTNTAQDAIIGYALDNNLMNERYGSLNVTVTPEFEGYSNEIARLERERISQEKQSFRDSIPRTQSQWLLA